MATEIAKAYVQIMPSAKGIKAKIEDILGPVDGAGESAGQSLGAKLVGGIKKVIAAAAIGKMIQASLMEGANLQQSLGGVETMFKDSADTVVKNAKNAYKTAGLSANQYMEQVTSFSASLLQGLGGDTAKAAKYADMAVRDMGDNANKFGTNIQDIQNAYQGFAKQNYTMLDNLKLGYGGTKSEMERLIKDANRVKEANGEMADLSIESFADIVEAINWVQRDLGVFGTTSQEAAETFSGSFTAMKAAAQNVLGNLSLGEDIMPSLLALVETTSTFLFNNFIPMVGNVLKGLPVLVGGLLKEGISTLVEKAFGSEFANQIRARFDGIGEVFGRIWEKLQTLIGKVREFAGEFDAVETGKVIVEGLMTTLETLVGYLENAVDGLIQFVDWLGSGTPSADAFQTAVVTLGTGLATAWTYTKLISGAKAVFAGFETAKTVATTAMDVGRALIGVANGSEAAKLGLSIMSGESKLASAALGLISNPIPAIITAVAALAAGLIYFFTQTETGKEIWSNFVEWAKVTWEGLKEFFANLWDSIKETAANLWDSVVEAWNSAVELAKSVWDGIVEFFSNLWETIKSTAETAWNLLVQGIMMIVQPFIDTFMSYWTAMSEGLSQVWEGIKMIFEGAWELIKSIVMGAVLLICDLITGDFDQMGADLALIWESIKSAINLIWEGIKTYLSGVIETIVSFAVTWFNNLMTNLSNIWNTIKSTASATWEWIKSTVSSLISGLVSGAQATWESFKSFLSSLWNTIKSIATSTWESIKASVQNSIDNLVNGAKRAWENLKQSVQDTVNRVRSIFDGLRSIDLGAAGRAIMDSFLGGLKSAWGAVQNFVGGIADWIRKNKGPIEYDRKLLIPAGKAIMQGFGGSLEEHFKDVQDSVKNMAPSLVDVFGTEELELKSQQSVMQSLAVDDFSSQMSVDDAQAGLVSHLLRVEELLTAILNKDMNTYLDGELLARDSYERHAAMMLREGI